MLSHPQPGQRVVIHYASRALPMPHHGATGTVVIAGKGKPRNHLIQLADGQRVVVPAGHLNKLVEPHQ